MDRIKVGDYVRFDEGKIGVVKYVDIVNIGIVSNGEEIEISSGIDKNSPNIIDLIEVGDYVNGCLIVEINKDPFIKGQINLWTNMIMSEGEPFPNEYYKAKIIEKDIKTIVTHEQFSGMEYKV